MFRKRANVLESGVPTPGTRVCSPTFSHGNWTLKVLEFAWKMANYVHAREIGINDDGIVGLAYRDV